MATFNEQEIVGLVPPKLFFTRSMTCHWRARIATNNPLFPRTAWFSIPGNSITEAKLRKPELPVD
jgi:hypothetical protein